MGCAKYCGLCLWCNEKLLDNAKLFPLNSYKWMMESITVGVETDTDIWATMVDQIAIMMV